MSGNESQEEDIYTSFENYIPLSNNIINTSFIEDKPKYKHVLSAKGKEQLCKHNFTIEKFKEQQKCPILQEKFIQGEEVISLPCTHIFKPDAIIQWLENENATCPVCRFKLESKEEEIPKEPPIRMTIESFRDYIERVENEREYNDIQRAIINSLED
jgi:hypothetical protein